MARRGLSRRAVPVRRCTGHMLVLCCLALLVPMLVALAIGEDPVAEFAQAFQAAKALDPREAPLSNAQRGRDRDEALSAYRQALELAPDKDQRLQVLYRMAALESWFTNGDIWQRPEKGVPLWQGVLSCCPPNSSIWYTAEANLASDAAWCRRLQLAILHWWNILRADPKEFVVDEWALPDVKSGSVQPADHVRKRQVIAVQAMAHMARMSRGEYNAQMIEVAIQFPNTEMAAEALRQLGRWEKVPADWLPEEAE